MMQKVLSALGTILVVVLALVIADQLSGALERYRLRKVAEKSTADANSAAADKGGEMRVAA